MPKKERDMIERLVKPKKKTVKGRKVYEIEAGAVVQVPEVDLDNDFDQLEKSVEALKALKIAFVGQINERIQEVVVEIKKKQAKAINEPA